MKFVISLFLVSMFASTTFAAQPLDFFKKAVNELDPQASDVKVATTYDPFKYASRVLQYIDRFAQQTIDGKRIAWSFYRVQYAQKNGVIQDCTGGIGYSLGLNSNQRHVALEGCNQDFYHATTQFYQIIDLTK